MMEIGGRRSRMSNALSAKERDLKHAEHKRYYARTAFKYERRRWTVDEDKLVLIHRIPDSELSPIIKRSMKSISNAAGVCARRHLRTRRPAMPESKEREVENNNLPEMTDEQRKAALERSAEARRERMEFKELVKKVEISLADALDDDRAKRIRVHEFLMCIPGIGKAKADDIMRKLGIAENRRVQGLGCRQREGIIELVAKLK